MYKVILDGLEIWRVDMPWGYVLFGYPGKNEMTIVNTEPTDPPGFRFISDSGGLGKWSFCVGTNPKDAVEVFLFQGKKDERTKDRPDINYGEGTIHVKGPVLNPNDPRDDGMHRIALMLHDYVWIKDLDLGPVANPPKLNLPPAPPKPEPPVDDWLSPESQAKRKLEIDRIRKELEPMPLDDGRVKAYMDGRNRNLTEVHDDELNRAGYDFDPCGGANKIPVV